MTTPTTSVDNDTLRTVRAALRAVMREWPVQDRPGNGPDDTGWRCRLCGAAYPIVASGAAECRHSPTCPVPEAEIALKMVNALPRYPAEGWAGGGAEREQEREQLGVIKEVDYGLRDGPTPVLFLSIAMLGGNVIEILEQPRADEAVRAFAVYRISDMIGRPCVMIGKGQMWRYVRPAGF